MAKTIQLRKTDGRHTFIKTEFTPQEPDRAMFDDLDKAMLQKAAKELLSPRPEAIAKLLKMSRDL